MIKKYLNKLKAVSKPAIELDKQASETKFWDDELLRYVDWYNGKLPEMYDTPCPTTEQKIVARELTHSAILTWHKLHQEVKYLYDLNLDRSVFKSKKILDIGSGPMPSATCFEQADLYCLDPLLDRYLKVGFPIHLYGDMKFVHAYSEKIPVKDDFFDVIISANALDHVDNFEITASEIKRVLKPGGKLVFHVHYHPPSQNEPLELSDERMINAFAGVPNFRKTAESKDKFGYRCTDDESYAVWSNL